MIIEYEEKYLEDIKNLLVELEEYLVKIDEDNLDRLHPDYREKMALKDLQDCQENNGKCYLYVEGDKVLGLIMGAIFPYDELDYLDYTCPKRGTITELVVTNKTRNQGIGQALINKIEGYFHDLGCNYVNVDVFAYNEIAQKFYTKKGYHTRMYTMIKEVTD